MLVSFIDATVKLANDVINLDFFSCKIGFFVYFFKITENLFLTV